MSEAPHKATDQEARFFLAIIRHQKNKPEIDWEAVAADAGYSNGNTAQTRFGQIKRKLNMATGDTPAKATPAKGRVSKATGSRSTGKGKTTGKGKGKGQSKAAQLLDEETHHHDDDEPEDVKIPLNYDRVKLEEEVEEQPAITIKKE